mmetsp:Transcript_20728/g.67072  ORF Transcript_20728/g.67072 Transcript_20728/m.67072 type:complete len:108 (-) Transcript_20728:42-365(-)
MGLLLALLAQLVGGRLAQAGAKNRASDACFSKSLAWSGALGKWRTSVLPSLRPSESELAHEPDAPSSVLRTLPPPSAPRECPDGLWPWLPSLRPRLAFGGAGAATAP